MSLDHVKQSVRTLIRHKRFSSTAIVCLGLAVALNTTMYSVLDALIHPRSDVVEPERIVYIQYYGDYRGVIQPHERRASVLALSFIESATLRPYSWGDARMVEVGGAVREAYVETVGSNFFTLLGIRAKAGRLIGPSDMGSEAEPIVMTERLWKQLFPDRPFGPASVFVNGQPRAVVGLLSSTSLFTNRDIWELVTPAMERNRIPTLLRLKRGVTHAQAQAELDALSQRFRQTTGEGRDAGWLMTGYVGRGRYGDWGFHIALIGSVVAVLLIACANLANMQLARGVSRARELATRAAVGASRRDLVWQLVVESAWLAAAGLLLSAVLTFWGIQLIEHFIPKSLSQYIAYPQVSWRVMLVAVGATLLCLVLVGLLPAIRLSRVDINELLKSGAGTGKTVSARRQYGLLVVTEVALSLAILCSAGLLVRSALQVQNADYNERYSGNVYASVSVRAEGLNDRRTRYQIAEQLIRHALTTDSVTRASTRTCMYPKRKAISTYDAAGQPANFFAPMYCYNLVSSDYFRISRQRIVEGRNFSSGEVGEIPVIVDMAAARTLWKGASPLGKQVKLDSAHVPGPWYRVIGVVEPPPPVFNSRKDMALLDNPGPNTRELIGVTGPIFSGQIYVLNTADVTSWDSSPAGTARAMGIALQVATRGDVRGMPLRLYGKLGELGPNISASYPRTWGQLNGFDALKARHSFMATLFVIFGLFGLALAALGVYAIIAHMVAQRTREFGVRIAVGAGERDIRQMVLREGNVLTLSGIAVGLLLTYKSAAYVRAFVFSDWDRYDSRVFAVVVVVLFAAAWLASYLPARRAMRINPVEALRND